MASALTLWLQTWLLLLLTTGGYSASNLGYDHRSHSVPGRDKVLYDLKGEGSVIFHLDGSGSHSHYFDSGPPVVSGFIEKFEWTDTSTGKVICDKERCSVPFRVGTTLVKLQVTDNTGDVAEDHIRVTVLAKGAARFPPSVSQINPPKGPEEGNNIVSITGNNFYHDSTVYFGSQIALDVKHVDLKTIVCTAPKGQGIEQVTVVSSKGTSNGLSYEFQKPSEIPIYFEKEYWTNEDGSRWKLDQVTGIVIGKDHRYYMATRTGLVAVAKVDRKLTVLDSCTGAYVGDGRAIGGIGFNPMDQQHRLFVSTNTFYFENSGSTWYNGKVETVNIGWDGCPVLGETIISGLPVSNHDHGVNKIIFTREGKMLISVGSSTNAGISEKGDGLGGFPESPLSAAILIADYLKPGFDGHMKYSNLENPAKARVVRGDVKVFASGTRNCFGMIAHKNGEIYATDNGPNIGFGRTSLDCSRSQSDPETKDKILRITNGSYYGHPNRNRGRYDEEECIYKHPRDRSSQGYVEPLAQVESSTNGIIDYPANSFQGILRDNLFLSKVAFDEDGTLWRAELSENGHWIEAGPYRFEKESGLSMVMGLWGEIVMPQLEKSQVLVYRPQENAPSVVQMLNVYPNRGPSAGGTEVIITGQHLNQPDTQVLFGGKPCSGIWDVYYDSLKCITPEGSGRVNVLIKQGEVESATYGFDFEYI